MILKNLTIAAAFVLISGLGASPALAQNTPPAEPTMAAPAGAPPADGAMAPAATPAPAPAPAVHAPTPTPAANAAPSNPYGLTHIVQEGNPVSLTILVLLAIMSIGTWYIFIMKFFEQSRILGQASAVEKPAP